MQQEDAIQENDVMQQEDVIQENDVMQIEDVMQENDVIMQEDKEKEKPIQEKNTFVTLCSRCNEVVPPDGKVRKRVTRRRCKACAAVSLSNYRKNSPVNILKYKWSNSAYQNYRNIDSKLKSHAAITIVYDRWEGKSVISGYAHVEKLCVTCYRSVESSRDITLNDLIIVTSTESQALSKTKDNNIRFSRLTPEARTKIEQKEGIPNEFK